MATKKKKKDQQNAAARRRSNVDARTGTNTSKGAQREQKQKNQKAFFDKLRGYVDFVNKNLMKGNKP